MSFHEFLDVGRRFWVYTGQRQEAQFARPEATQDGQEPLPAPIRPKPPVKYHIRVVPGRPPYTN